MALRSVTNEQLYPPRRCTKEIPSSAFLPILNKQEKASFTTKAEEFRTPPKERWYCPEKKCGQWIPSPKGSRPLYYRICSHCRTTICILCRGLWDSGQKCPKRKKNDAPTVGSGSDALTVMRWWSALRAVPICSADAIRHSGMLLISSNDSHVRG